MGACFVILNNINFQINLQIVEDIKAAHNSIFSPWDLPL